MNRKLILIAVAMLGVLGANVSEAKVCRLGDADCGISDFYGSGNPTCSSEYITCPEPRIGATYCKEIDGDGNVTVKYAPKDCCSSLGYEECSDKWEAGRGDSCRTFNGAGKAVTYWQQCGCQYGFAETDDEGNFYRQDVSYSQTCGTFVHGDRCMGIDVGSERCKFISCNVDRRFVGESRSYCKYRLDTSCGSFGCRQVYDCDNDAEYYRNDSEYLSSGNKNFIDHRGSDVLSNELDASGNLLPSVSYNDDCSVNSQEYNIVNRYVCNYLQSDGNFTEDQDKGIKDVELGFDCGEGVPNYCYLWKGCNNTRRWFNSDLNVGVLYSENLYPKWFSVVENASGYDYNGMYPIINPKHHEFLKLESVNPNYDKYEEIEPGYDSEGNPVFSYNGKSLSICNNAELTVGEGGSTGDIYTSDLNTSTVCYIVNKDNGCAYIRKDCHQDDNGHRCWKKIGCANENRFYSSFINAAVKGYIDGATVLSDNTWYATSVNTSFYYDVYYNGLEAKEIYPACLYRMNNCNDDSGCFRKEGCAEGFEDIRDHTEIETDWETWFEDIRPICNDSTRCYKAISCTLETGAYSSVPNTSFFVTINSLATGLICYKGVECRIDGGSYTSTPNTSFFITINSLSSASTCYRGQECHSASGAYTSAPNNFFFSVQKSISSGSTCYRGVYCLGLDEGAYTSSPNTSFFEIISSHASSSSCFRGQNCSPDAGSYTSTPNTSFFITINSLSSGSICYRGQECHITAGAYTSTPNTLFFEVQESLSSGSTCYRGTKCRFETGIYTSSPNTSFFLILNSHASGSNCYRSEGCHFAAGAYASAPNTSFFVTIHSLSTNSYCYRGQECYVDAGSYTSTPNTSFFITINSLSSASTCYRGQECYIDGGAYTSTPNEYFFYVQESLSSGSTCYRGVSCSGLDGGAYTSTPNTSFFEVIYSLASGSSCYRGQNCSPDSGAYTSTPNTSFFITINSLSSASTCYRGQECHIDSGSYTSTPNTSFFITINSLASSSTCYRGQECNIDGGAYTSTPNTVFFDVINSLSSASTCYRGEICAETSNDFENTSFFNMVFSLSSGSTCYRASGCNIEAGAYTSEPNTSFFVLDINTNAKDDSTCYRGQDCHIAAGAYTSTPNTSFFVTNHSLASGSTAYRAEASHISAGAYTSTPNTSYFITIHSLASGSTAYRGQDSNLAAGAYTSEPNTSYFITIHSLASGSTAYRAEMVCIDCGSYSSSPNILFFSVVSSHASGSISYRSEDSHITNGAYTSTPNTSFFITIRSLSSGSTAYRGESAHVAAGAYTSTPNTMFFDVIKSLASGSTSYRAEKTHITNGAYTSTPNTSFFVTSYSLASGSTSYRGESAHIAAGAYANEPNTMFFNTVYSLASSLKVYRAEKVCIECGSYTSKPNTSFFLNDYSLGSGLTSYRGREVHIDAGAYNNPPNTSFFITIHSLATGLTVYRAESVNIAAGAYISTPNHAFFNIDYSLGSGSKCYRGRSCASTAVVEANLNTLYFVYNYSLSSGSTCYRSSACREEVGAYSSGPNTSFFNVLSSTNAEQDSTCYRGQDCHIEAGAYTSTPNTSYFITISSLSSGSTAYRAERVNIDAGAYTSVPNTLFFVTVYSLASGSTSYRAVAGTPQTYTSSPNTSFFITITSHASSLERYRGESAHITAGAYETTPNITFFNVIQSSASGSISYRAEKVCVECGSYTSEPNTSFFATSFSLGSGSKSYRGEGAQIDAGAYSTEPNTMFFNTIYSLASGLKMYRAESVCIDCGSYTSTPNTSFFSIDYSLGSGSTSYRGREVHIDAGAYSSTPNTIFFKTVSSLASGSIVYRAYEANVDEGSYAEKPNEIFFTYVYSHASGSISYRAGGISAYTSSPNTSFFEVVSSSATGLVGWQATSVHYRAGAYGSAPNDTYFITISSHASGIPSFRAESVNITAGSYTSEPNTSFFVTSYSLGSGSKSYRAESVCVDCGAYSSSPNTVFFVTSYSLGSGLTSFRVENVNITDGSYTSTPNTSFFVTSFSLGSGSTSYRAETINIDAGAYLSEPNTVFFNITSSHASGIPSFRAEKVCVECGSYSSEPNTVFFSVDYSLGSGSKSYRVSGIADGAYNNPPNTSFFIIVHSLATGLTVYRAESVNIDAGAYRSAPNDTFFNIISSHASGTPSFRAESVNITAGSYTSEPNTSFFVTSFSLGSGSTSYRAESINIDAGAYETAPNTAFFITISSQATGIECFRAEGCKTTAGASDKRIDEVYDEASFFVQLTSLASGTTCYRVDACNEDYYSYAQEDTSPYVLYRNKTAEQHGGLKCYKGTACNEDTGYKDPEKVNTSYFNELSSVQYDDGKFCQLGRSCHYAAGAYTVEPDTSFFVTSSEISGENNSKTCYRAEECNIDAGAYASKPNTIFFDVEYKDASGSRCYRAQECSSTATETIDTVFFKTISSHASGTECFRATDCQTTNGSFDASSYINTLLFKPYTITAPGKTCYYGGSCNTDIKGVYQSGYHYNDAIFTSIGMEYSPSIDLYCGIVECNTTNGYMPNTSLYEWFSYRTTDGTSLFEHNFNTSKAANNLICYQVSGCNTTSTFIVDTCAFSHYNTSGLTTSGYNVDSLTAGPTTCYKATSCSDNYNYVEHTTAHPNTIFFDRYTFRYDLSKAPHWAEKFFCAYATGCDPNVATTDPDTSFFIVSEKTAYTSKTSTVTCHKPTRCASTAASEKPSTVYFNVQTKTLSTTCYRATSCRNSKGSYGETEVPEPLYFSYTRVSSTGTSCFYTTGCDISNGAYTSSPNTSFFETNSITAGTHTCYRGIKCNIDAGAYTSTPNTTFFKVISSLASGSRCYRAQECSSTTTETKPDTIFFQVISSKASGTTCHRATGCQPSNGSFEFSSNINSLLFKVDTITATGTTCYYGGDCNTNTPGVYSTGIDTTVFTTVASEYSPALRIYCYQAECNTSNGYMPNTSLFEWFSYKRRTDDTSLFYEHHFNSNNANNDFTCYQVNGCNTTSTFVVDSSVFSRYNTSGLTTTGYNISSLTAGRTTCYKASSCTDNYNYVEYMTSSPNSTYFDHGKFKYDISKAPHWADKFYCAYAVGCVPNVSSETVTNTSLLFFNTSSYEAYKSSTSKLKCYFGSSCASTATASEPSPVYFNVQTETLSTTCYRATSCKNENGSYGRDESIPNSVPGMFTFNRVGAIGTSCFYVTGCNIDGFYSSSPNTSFFNTRSATAGSHTCYVSGGCNIDAGAYTSTPNTAFFKVDSSSATGRTCYRSQECNSNASAIKPSENYFEFISSKSSGFTCYRGTECKSENGSYSSSAYINTELFNTSSIYAAPKTCYFGSSCKSSPGVYQVGTKTVNTNIYTISASAQNPEGLGCAKAVCNTSKGFVSNDNSSYWFDYGNSYSFNSGQPNNFVCYKINGCNTTSNFVVDEATYNSYNSSGFSISGYRVTSKTAGGVSCYESTTCNTGYNYVEVYTSVPNTTHFASGNFLYDTNGRAHWKEQFICAYATGCNTDVASSSYDPQYHKVTIVEAYKSDGSKQECHISTRCADGASETPGSVTDGAPYRTCYYVNTSYHSSCAGSTSANPTHLHQTDCIDHLNYKQTIGERTCYISKCSAASTSYFGTYSNNCTDSKYFKQKYSSKVYEDDDKGLSLSITGDIKLYGTENGVTCLTAAPEPISCAADIANLKADKTINDENDSRRFFVFNSTTKTCGKLTTAYATGCNQGKLSYPVSYISSANTVDELSKYMIVSESEDENKNNKDLYATNGVYSFEDAFVLIGPDKAKYNGSKLSDTNCASCFVACACNTANGWSPIKPSGAYYRAKVGFNMAYKSIDATAKSTSSSKEFTASGTQTLISEGSRAYSMSTMGVTSSEYKVVDATEPLSCYKQKDSFYTCTFNWTLEGEYNTSSFYKLDSLDCTTSGQGTHVKIKGSELNNLLSRAEVPLNISNGRIDINMREFKPSSYPLSTSDFYSERPDTAYFSPQTAAKHGLYTVYTDHSGYISFNNARVNEGYLELASGGTINNYISSRRHNGTSGFSVPHTCVPGSTDTFCVLKTNHGDGTSVAGYITGAINIINRSNNNVYLMNMRDKKAFRLNLTEAYSQGDSSAVMFKSGGREYYMVNYTETDKTTSNPLYDYPAGEAITVQVHANPAFATGNSGSEVIKKLDQDLDFIYDGTQNISLLYVYTNYGTSGIMVSSFYNGPIDYEFNYPTTYYNTADFDNVTYPSSGRMYTSLSNGKLEGDSNLSKYERTLRSVKGCINGWEGGTDNCSENFMSHYALYNSDTVYAIDGEGINSDELRCETNNGIYDSSHYYVDEPYSGNFPETSISSCYAKKCATGYTLYSYTNLPSECIIKHYSDGYIFVGDTWLECENYENMSNDNKSPYLHEGLDGYICAKHQCDTGYDYIASSDLKYVDGNPTNDSSISYTSIDSSVTQAYCQDVTCKPFRQSDIFTIDNSKTVASKGNDGYCYYVGGCADGYKLVKSLPKDCKIDEDMAFYRNYAEAGEVKCKSQTGYAIGSSYCLKTQCENGGQYFTNSEYEEFETYFSTSGCSASADGKGYCCNYTGCNTSDGYVKGETYDGNLGTMVAPKYCTITSEEDFETLGTSTVDCTSASGYILSGYNVNTNGKVISSTYYHSGSVLKIAGNTYYCMKKPCSDGFYFLGYTHNGSLNTNGVEYIPEVSNGVAKEYCYQPIGCKSPYDTVSVNGLDSYDPGKVFYNKIVDKGYYNCDDKVACPDGYFYSSTEDAVSKRWQEYEKKNGYCYKIASGTKCGDDYNFRYTDIGHCLKGAKSYETSNGYLASMYYYHYLQGDSYSGGNDLGTYCNKEHALCSSDDWSKTGYVCPVTSDKSSYSSIYHPTSTSGTPAYRWDGFRSMDRAYSNVGYTVSDDNGRHFCHMRFEGKPSGNFSNLKAYGGSIAEWNAKGGLNIQLGIINVVFDDVKLLYTVSDCSPGYTRYTSLPTQCSMDEVSGLITCSNDKAIGSYNFSGAGVHSETKIHTGYNSSTCAATYTTAGTYCINNRITGLTAKTQYQHITSGKYILSKDAASEISNAFTLYDTNSECFKSTNFICKKGSVFQELNTGFTNESSKTIRDIDGNVYIISHYARNIVAGSGTGTGTGCVNDCTVQISSYTCVNGTCCY